MKCYSFVCQSINRRKQEKSRFSNLQIPEYELQQVTTERFTFGLDFSTAITDCIMD